MDGQVFPQPVRTPTGSEPTTWRLNDLICFLSDEESALNDLTRANQAARLCASHERQFLVDLLIEKLSLESSEAIQDILLREFIWIMEEKWQLLTKEQSLSLFTMLSDSLTVQSETSQTSIQTMQQLVISQKLSPEMLGKIVRTIESNFTNSKKSKKMRQFQIWNAELLRAVLPQMEVAGAGCDPELLSFFRAARDICWKDFAGFGVFERFALSIY